MRLCACSSGNLDKFSLFIYYQYWFEDDLKGERTMAEPEVTKSSGSADRDRARIDRFCRYFSFAPEPGSRMKGCEEMVIEQSLKQLWEEWFTALENFQSKTDDFRIMLSVEVLLAASGVSANEMADELLNLAWGEKSKFGALLNACDSAIENGYRIPVWGAELLAAGAETANAG